MPTLFAQSLDNPNYSNAIYRHSSPEQFLAVFETHLHDDAVPMNRFVNLPYAAKAALEAGQFQKAEAYAIEVLKLADTRASKKSTRLNPRSAVGIGTADFYGNFVLGRLALLRTDIRAAAGKTTGDAALNSYGPNMSLAQELLKRGDLQSREDVIMFLQECKVFWRTSPNSIDSWTTSIRQNKTVDFGDQSYR